MLDSHCHLDRYKDPVAVAREAARRGVFVVAVTNLPSHFVAGLPHVKALPRVRLALGLHPLAARDHAGERENFASLLSKTSFVGEVGLDYSREGRGTEEEQRVSFELVASSLARTPKFVTLHSRGAEKDTVAVLAQYKVSPAVFHWYSGALATLDDALAAGHYFSVNPAMTSSANGRKVIARIPKDRILTETDGPFAKWLGKAATPEMVEHVEGYLADIWGEATTSVRATVWTNFRSVLTKVGLAPVT